MQAKPDLEDILRIALRAVQRGPDGLTEALDRLAAPIHVTDAAGLLTHYNQACVALTGRTPRLGEDRWCVTWELYHEDGHALTHASSPMVTAVRERRPVEASTAIALRPDGTWVRFRSWPTRAFDQRGHLVGAVNILKELKTTKTRAVRGTKPASCIDPAKSDLVIRSEILNSLGVDRSALVNASHAMRRLRAEPTNVSNDLLKSVAADCPELLGRVERVALVAGSRLIWPNQQIRHVYFLESGLASVIMHFGQKRAELVLVGREGFAGHCVAFGLDRTPRSTSMLVGGTALQISVDDLREIMVKTPILRERLLQFVRESTNQSFETACATAFLTVECRLARWLIMATDRIGPEIPVTHEALAYLLGTRRASVTKALHLLEGEKAIRSWRSKVIITDHAKLEEILVNSQAAAASI